MKYTGGLLSCTFCYLNVILQKATTQSRENDRFRTLQQFPNISSDEAKRSATGFFHERSLVSTIGRTGKILNAMFSMCIFVQKEARVELKK